MSMLLTESTCIKWDYSSIRYTWPQLLLGRTGMFAGYLSAPSGLEGFQRSPA